MSTDPLCPTCDGDGYVDIVDGILDDGRVTIGCEHTFSLAAALRAVREGK